MKKITALLSALTIPSLLWCAASLAQQQATQVQVTGHVYEPAKLEPSDERVNQLKLPPGFRITKFALQANPRIIAVNDDGTIYLTKREPGALVMLRGR